MKKKEWLDSLQVGDKVAWVEGGWAHSEWTTGTISRRTKTLIIVKKGGLEYQHNNVNGRRRGSSGGVQPCYIEPVTAEVEDAMRRRGHIKALRAIKWDRLKTDALAKIVSAVAECE